MDKEKLHKKLKDVIGEVWKQYHDNDGYSSEEISTSEDICLLLEIKIRELFAEITREENIDERHKIGFYYSGREVCWEDIPESIRKHDYPYYFDRDGNDCYPVNQESLITY